MLKIADSSLKDKRVYSRLLLGKSSLKLRYGGAVILEMRKLQEGEPQTYENKLHQDY